MGLGRRFFSGAALVGFLGLLSAPLHALTVTLFEPGSGEADRIFTDITRPGYISQQDFWIGTFHLKTLHASVTKGSFGQSITLTLNGTRTHPLGASLFAMASDTGFIDPVPRPIAPNTPSTYGTTSYITGYGYLPRNSDQIQSSVEYLAWVDTTNAAGGQQQMAGYDDGKPGPNEVFTPDNRRTVFFPAGNNPFSMTQVITIRADMGNQSGLYSDLVFDASMTTALVPLPESLPFALMGIGLLGLLRRKRSMG